MDHNYPDFREIKKTANGGLSTNIYRKIYDKVLKSEPGDILEVGAAHGAGTITMALALKNSGREEFKVYSFEKIVGGSREAFGDKSENIEIIERNLKQFGVSDYVKMIYTSVDEGNNEVPSNRLFSVMMLDADGAIDRDLKHFYNQVKPGAPVIIDDCQDFVKIKRKGFRNLHIDLKHLLTYQLTEYFIEQGLLEREEIERGTLFTKKPFDLQDKIDFSSLDITSVYRRLTFTDGKLPLLLKRNIYRFLNNSFMGQKFLSAFKSIKGDKH